MQKKYSTEIDTGHSKINRNELAEIDKHYIRSLQEKNSEIEEEEQKNAQVFFAVVILLVLMIFIITVAIVLVTKGKLRRNAYAEMSY